MLSKSILLDKMKMHFPTWMEIRKRVNTSAGGQLLVAEAESFALIQEAIDNYKKDFFIDRYENQEDEIVAFVYKYQVGIIDPTKLTLLSPVVTLTESLDDFYASTGHVYYEDGYLYLRIEDISGNKISFNYNGYVSSGIIEKMHVWNVFDEFAVFVGLERHVNEKNSELKKRILNSWKKPMNSTTTGLKNTILNELLILDPTLTVEEIKIEGQTPDNLVKYYEEFGSVIEKLAYINRDLARTKRWDIDTWIYQYKSIDYIPHAWDVAIEAYANGIGFEGDLKVELVNPNRSAVANIKLYEQSSTKIQDYFKNNSMKKNIALKLKRYSNVLNPIIVKYKITASEVLDITDSGIEVVSYKTIKGEEERYVVDIAESVGNVQIDDKSLLPNNKNYKLVFEPTSEFYAMQVQECNVESYDSNGNKTKTQSLLTETQGFVLKNGSLISANMASYAEKVSDYIKTTNAIDTANGIEINNISNHAVLEYDLTNLGNKQLIVAYDCKSSPIDNSIINQYGFYMDQQAQWNSDYTGNTPHFISFELLANKISFDVVGNGCTILTTINGVQTVTPVVGNISYSTPIFDMPETISIVITSPGTIQFAVSNIKYAKYEFKLSTQNYALIKFTNAYGIPDNAGKLFVDIMTYTGFSPALKYLYVGSTLKTVKYETPIISYENLGRKLVVKSNCNVKLVEVDNSGVIVSTTDNFEPYPVYIATNDNAYVKLNLEEYISVFGVKLVNGKVETTSDEDIIFIRLKAGQQISKVKIDGERQTIIKKMNLYQMIGVTKSSEVKLYASKLMSGVFVEYQNLTTQYELNYSTISGNGADRFELINTPENIECAFVATNDGSIEVTKRIDHAFSVIHLYPKASTTYIAYNESKVIKEETKAIQIVNLFSPFIPTNVLMLYTVECISVNGTVRFDTASSFNAMHSWSLGRNNLAIKVVIDKTAVEHYEVEKMNLDEETLLTSNVVELDRFYTLPSGEMIELSKYIVESTDTIIYKKATVLDTPESKPEFYHSENFIIEDDGFNKLRYSNVDKLIYIGTVPYAENLSSNIPPEDYDIMNEEGIVIWNNKVLESSAQRIYIYYTIRIPDYIVPNINDLYKMIEYDLSAYKEIESFEANNIKDGSVVNLATHPKYNRVKNTGKIVIKFNAPGFKADITNDIITFRNVSKSNTVAVKTGYYYDDGQEYFMFSDKTADTINQYNMVSLFNVNNYEGTMVFNKRSSNLIKNSVMEKKKIDDIFNLNLKEDSVISGVSTLNSITACDNYNYWTTFGTKLSLVKGLNGLGIKLNPIIENGYAYIDISKRLHKDSEISFFAQNDIEIYLGKEIKVNGISLSKTVSIVPVVKIPKGIDNIGVYRFVPEDAYKYYLIVKGSGIIDDIIIQDATKSRGNVHKKNIDFLFNEIEETILNDYTCKLFFDADGYTSEGTEVNAEGQIINSSSISWGLTLLKIFNDQKSWSRCKLDKIKLEDGIIKTLEGKIGTLETEAIYIGNVNTIKNVVFKINDVTFDNMTGFSVRIFASSTLNGEYREIFTTKNNVGYITGKYLLSYIKMIITIPEKKVINDIGFFAEYKSDHNVAPAEVPINNGSFVSKIFDSNYESGYKVKNINLDSISSQNDVVIQIRGARGDVWTEWKDVKINASGNVLNSVTFDNYRFFQFKVQLRTKRAYVKIESIDLEVVK